MTTGYRGQDVHRLDPRAPGSPPAGAPGGPVFRPVQVDEIELAAGPLAPLVARPDSHGDRYETARVLVRLHGAPIGTIMIDLRAGQGEPAQLAAQASAALGDQVAAHLAGDGLDPDPLVTLGGLPQAPDAPCRAVVSPPADAALVSVVVATAGRPEQVVRCVRTILTSRYPQFEVLVVDNSPVDPRTHDLITAAFDGDRRVRYLAEPMPGASRARNTGTTFARGAVIAFTDDDVEVDPDWISALASPFADPEVACVTGLIVGAQLETAEQVWFENHSGFTKGYLRQVFDLGEHRDPSPLFPYQLGLYGTGANMAFRKKALTRLGGFDVALGPGSPACGGEDLDGYLSVINSGQRIVYEPRALVRHHHRSDYQALRRQMRQYGVGLAAVLTKRLLTDHDHRGDMLRRVPVGLRHALRDGSRQKPETTADYPRELQLLELMGLLGGPFAYVRARMRNAWLTA